MNNKFKTKKGGRGPRIGGQGWYRDIRTERLPRYPTPPVEIPKAIRALWSTVLAFLVTGCLCHDTLNYFNIGIGGPGWSTGPLWGDVSEVNSDFQIHVTYGLAVSVPDDVVELFDGDTPVPLEFAGGLSPDRRR